MKHYYTNNEDLISEPEQFIFTYRGKELIFTSDHGVFSKKMIDFGSRVLLDAIELDEGKSTLLDVGCGYGTFRALLLAKQNLAANNLEANVYLSSVYENVTNKYDVIVTNPPIRAGKETVTKILVEAKEHLNLHGEIWVVIQKKQGAPSAKKNLESVFGNANVVKKDKGYYILKAINK